MGAAKPVVKSDKKTKAYVCLVVLIILIVLTYFLASNISKITGKTVEADLSEVDACLAKKEITFYTAKDCSECAEQTHLLGNHLRGIKYVDCGTDSAACAHIEKVPAWEIGNQVLFGVLNPPELAALAGC